MKKGAITGLPPRFRRALRQVDSTELALAQSSLLKGFEVAVKVVGPFQGHLRPCRRDGCVGDQAEKIGQRRPCFVDAAQLAQRCGANPIGSGRTCILSQRLLCRVQRLLVSAGNEQGEREQVVPSENELIARAEPQSLVERSHSLVATSQAGQRKAQIAMRPSEIRIEVEGKLQSGNRVIGTAHVRFARRQSRVRRGIPRIQRHRLRRRLIGRHNRLGCRWFPAIGDGV